MGQATTVDKGKTHRLRRPHTTPQTIVHHNVYPPIYHAECNVYGCRWATFRGDQRGPVVEQAQAHHRKAHS